ncbi:hypothetical protein AOC36_01775 [Erysipelothrix larvae]|uniref:Acid phosphatase n=1 Tax=Erysipelothrix larvae TaxID=1514105 RepID=A0A0X8GYU2_9FIRM|nr:divergent PAP2 family protein [Erysipelothrix larvae]AMC92759.1 hypothetical protein AOC36_01775 [Erysipelothrix larvae]
MFNEFYPLLCAIVANIVAQLLKPIFHYIKTGNWDFKMALESGGFPSSHTALVVGLAFAIGYSEGFTSTFFYIAFCLMLIVVYDAANVRYYAGQNIRMTKQLINDFEVLTKHKLTDPVYQERVKTVLGHKWVEVIGGLVLGFIVATALYFFR